jgi:hypothetical protein
MNFAEIEASRVGRITLSATTGLVGTPNGTRTAYEPPGAINPGLAFNKGSLRARMFNTSVDLVIENSF